MKTPVRVAQMVIRGAGALLLLLGIPIWTGTADGLVPLHVLFGVVLVVALWSLTYLFARSGLSAWLVGVAILWGLLAPILGLSQEHLLTGSGHWLIQVLHLLVGLGAIGIGEMLAMQLKRRAEAGVGDRDDMSTDPAPRSALR